MSTGVNSIAPPQIENSSLFKKQEGNTEEKETENTAITNEDKLSKHSAEDKEEEKSKDSSKSRSSSMSSEKDALSKSNEDLEERVQLKANFTEIVAHKNKKEKSFESSPNNNNHTTTIKKSKRPAPEESNSETSESPSEKRDKHKKGKKSSKKRRKSNDSEIYRGKDGKDMEKIKRTRTQQPSNKSMGVPFCKISTQSGMERNTYKGIKYLDLCYQVGEFLYLHLPDNEKAIARLNKIIGSGADPLHPDYPMLEVNWYFRLSELQSNAKLSELDKTGIGENELFSSTLSSKVYANQIVGKCHIDSYKKYAGRYDVKEDEYYTRASYDMKTGEIDPPMELWERDCICNAPHHPHQFYVGCDRCDRWFHPKCLGLKDNDERLLKEKFYCNACQEQITS